MVYTLYAFHMPPLSIQFPVPLDKGNTGNADSGFQEKKLSSTLFSVNDIWNKSLWTAEMKWKWRNDRRSEHNLCNCVKKPDFFQASLHYFLFVVSLIFPQCGLKISLCILPPACVLLSVCSLHFTLSLHFTSGPQSAVHSLRLRHWPNLKFQIPRNKFTL